MTLRTVLLLELFASNQGADSQISIGFVTGIVGIPKVEANAIIHYLNELMSTTQEIQARFRWQKNDVAFWDNRICVSNARPSVCTRCLTRKRTTRHPTVLPHTADMQCVSRVTQSARIATLTANRRKRRGTLAMVCRKSTRMDRVNRITTIERAQDLRFQSRSGINRCCMHLDGQLHHC